MGLIYKDSIQHQTHSRTVYTPPFVLVVNGFLKPLLGHLNFLKLEQKLSAAIKVETLLNKKPSFLWESLLLLKGSKRNAKGGSEHPTSRESSLPQHMERSRDDGSHSSQTLRLSIIRNAKNGSLKPLPYFSSLCAMIPSTRNQIKRGLKDWSLQSEQRFRSQDDLTE